jgi:anti-anti-sigma factor
MRATRAQRPSFEGKTLELDGVVVVVVRGEVDLMSAPEFEALVDEAILDGGVPRPVLVDLDECTFMDSSGLAVLLRARDRVEGGPAIACSGGAPAARLLELAARSLLERYETRADALDALNALRR